MASDRTKDIVRTYLELPTADRSPAIDRLLDPAHFRQDNPPAANIIARHIRLRLTVGDLYDELGHYIAPDNQDNAEYFLDGYQHCQRRISRAYALLQENCDRADRLIEPSRPKPSACFAHRLRDRAKPRAPQAPLQFPEMEMD